MVMPVSVVFPRSSHDQMTLLKVALAGVICGMQI